MMETTEIIVEDGSETHPSWLLIRASRISANPGQHLFDSEVAHQHYIEVTISRCSRQRDLNRDWFSEGKTILKMAMSEAQWGAFVSSFGKGTGVPATLTFLNGRINPAPHTSRLDNSHTEVRRAGDRALEDIQKAQEAVQEAFDQNLGKKVLRERLFSLKCMVENGPRNMEFAAKSLTRHVEDVVTKARADVEGMVLAAQTDSVQIEGNNFSRLLGQSDD